MNRHPGGEEHTRRMMELAGLPAGAKILDAGAGDGETLQYLLALQYDAWGIDLAPGNDCVDQGSFLHMPYSDGSFDGIISQCAFYSGGDVEGAIREAYRVLKKGGVLMLSDVSFESLSDLAEKTGFKIQHHEDLTEEWREYYFEALWRGELEYCPGSGRCTYEMLICRKG